MSNFIWLINFVPLMLELESREMKIIHFIGKREREEKEEEEEGKKEERKEEYRID